MEVLLDKAQNVDAVLLDISMPILDGFDVLQIMEDNKINNIPIVLITAETTKTNVRKAIQYKISEFISKPFDPEIILTRLRAMFNISINKPSKIFIPNHIFTQKEISETNMYISRLKEIYKRYLNNINKSDKEYSRVSEIMEILLREYDESWEESELDDVYIDFISKAAYFYDIGKMAIPDILFTGNSTEERNIRTYESHTIIGADIVRLNRSPDCNYFVQTCRDMCMHHHERYDGKGFPHGIKGNDISVYTQICSMAIKFDRIFIKRFEQSETQFDFVLNEMQVDSGEFSHKVISLLKNCKFGLISYYKRVSKLENKIV